MGRETPKWGAHRVWGSPRPCRLAPGVSAPLDQGLEARALCGDTCPPPSRVPAPSAGRAAVPAARRDALN